MSVGDVLDAQRTELPCIMPGARLWRFAPWDGNQYVPYFYNPSLDADAGRMIFTGSRDDQEQVYLLDLIRDRVTQLTAAVGTNQNWSPYIRENVSGIRPQFIAWAQPDYQKVLYWEDNTLCLVNTQSLASERLCQLLDDVVPSVLHCSPAGWVSWGYLPTELQRRMQSGSSVVDLERDLRTGCGFNVYDLNSRKLALDVKTPFWPNHVAASPDHRQVLCCHEGAWEEQRMYLYDVRESRLRPLRPQDDGARIGHEFWVDSNLAGYHGSDSERGFFGTIDVATDARTERPIEGAAEHHYGHYHVSPDLRYVVTDGEISADSISIAPLRDTGLTFEPVCRHDWARRLDQRFHPHPNWHSNGRFITFTACETIASREVRSRVCLLELAADFA